MRLPTTIRFAVLASVALFVFTACPAPPPSAGPPPVPVDTPPETLVDNSDEPPAPELPDPRGDLPPVSNADVRAAEATAPQRAPSPSTPSAQSGTASVYSVQVFAAESRENAEAMARRVEPSIDAPVEVAIESDGVWRVYVGRSATRPSVDALRDRLRAVGYAEAWTRQRFVPDASTTADRTVPAGRSVYSVQVFASEDESGARAMVEEVRRATSLPVEIVQIGDLWKVFVGRSATREPIDAERDRLRATGYPDAWTYLREGY